MTYEIQHNNKEVGSRNMPRKNLITILARHGNQLNGTQSLTLINVYVEFFQNYLTSSSFVIEYVKQTTTILEISIIEELVHRK